MSTRLFLARIAALAAFLLLGGLSADAVAGGDRPGGAAAKLLRFDVTVTSADPFDPANEQKADAGPLRVRPATSCAFRSPASPRPATTPIR